MNKLANIGFVAGLALASTGCGEIVSRFTDRIEPGSIRPQEELQSEEKLCKPKPFSTPDNSELNQFVTCYEGESSSSICKIIDDYTTSILDILECKDCSITSDPEYSKDSRYSEQRSPLYYCRENNSEDFIYDCGFYSLNDNLAEQVFWCDIFLDSSNSFNDSYQVWALKNPYSKRWIQVEAYNIGEESSPSLGIYAEENQPIESHVSENVFEDSVVNYGDCTRSQLNALGSRLESIVNSTLDK